ncbi:hypothetical protein FOZ63_007357 [Perkinsus olseni]|uniref:Uncharacterized protein n=1 Tax=Perkinsus olseni TaxID=32597 RepID=A0A7J6SXP9_PEROL|nr:hypothetical protein FOZ63_007357 [Perkinsus olseni]KAF4737545.1 hypothetical protein FOZ62_017885 [Perkinsus olseni]
MWRVLDWETGAGSAICFARNPAQRTVAAVAAHIIEIKISISLCANPTMSYTGPILSSISGSNIHII